MRNFTPTEFLDLLDDAGYEARSYSGRNMYGKQCVAIVTADGIGRTLSTIFDCCETASECSDIVRNLRTDGMGTDTVYYWPSVPWKEEA